MNNISRFILIGLVCFIFVPAHSQAPQLVSFNQGWRFHLGELSGAENQDLDDKAWRTLSLPHDWSIELPFDKNSPTGTGGGALRGGVGWYRKTFTSNAAQRFVAIRFDGVYCNSEVWINGHYLGKRPNGYISFQYELTPYLKPGTEKNVLVVKVDNSQQPNSRWYSGSGIYRNVWLLTTDKIHIAYNGTYFYTPSVTTEQASVKGELSIENKTGSARSVEVQTTLLNPAGIKISTVKQTVKLGADTATLVKQSFTVERPRLWSIEQPQLYKAVSAIYENGKLLDSQSTRLGIRSFEFDVANGFILNGQRLKIRGVCNHHDLGCLGTAVNKSAIRRQLEILKGMGCNGIRTSHNPPAPELLDLCDEMGFIVMNETFDMWKRQKTKYDYHLDWDKWYRRDLTDHILRDRNHPSVFIWSVGNEIGEQWANEEDTASRNIIYRLVDIVRSLDAQRPTVTANNEIQPWNRLLQTNATDLTGYNYNHSKWDSATMAWPNKPFIVTESVSALQTRGSYDMPSDSIRRWPKRWDLPLLDGNADTTCSAYDNCSAPWGSTHEESLRVFEKYDHISGMYIWTGFDYIGEPTPYGWPARSSYFGIIDLAGFPKDVYWLYKSRWTQEPVLHIFPHWNWKPGQDIDVWAYYNNADEVELYVNGVSAGIRRPKEGELHVVWKLKYEAGTVKAVSRKNGKTVLMREIHTAGKATAITASVNKQRISREGDELAFVQFSIRDEKGVMVPDANQLLRFSVSGGSIAGVDNGSQTSMESFRVNQRKAFNGLCLAVIRPDAGARTVTVTATADGLKPVTTSFQVY